MKRATFLALGGLVAPYAPVEAPTLFPLVPRSLLWASSLMGAQGSITESELGVLRGLAWPQTYRDMVGTFGYPAHRTDGEDYYHLEGTSNWVVIEYSGPQATGYREE